jgi:hypothetical protein
MALAASSRRQPISVVILDIIASAARSHQVKKA